MTRGRRQPLFTSVVSSLNAAGSSWTVVLMLLICADVVARGALNHPIRGVAEIVSLSLVACVFLQLPHILRSGRLTRVEIFIDPLTARRPRRGHALDALHHLVGAALMALIFGASVPRFVDVWRSGDYVGTHQHFTAPLWPVQLMILIGSAFTTAEFLLLAGRHLRAAWSSARPETTPAGSAPGAGHA
ncbi:MAG: TRAP transporter small permease [Candidatus Rokubacteria bacterium]|nr:TRAP transporter small permease [Candidatus Rokubacteria bacterium]